MDEKNRKVCKMIAYTQELFSGTDIGKGSGDSTATPLVVKHGKEATIYLSITAVSGTNPTLGLTFKIYNSLRATWHTLASFDQKTSTGTDSGYLDYGIGEKMAVYYTVGGTNTPTFTFTIDVGIKER